MKFFNSTQKNMSFSDIVASIKYFIKVNPDCQYRLAVGADSQEIGKYTHFAVGIHIHRVGQGAWCCISRYIENRKYKSFKERIEKETALTYELAYHLNEELMDALCGFTLKYKNFDCKLEAHIDIGEIGESRMLVREMSAYFQGMGIEAKIKPNAFVASSYAGRYSRRIKAG